MITLANFHEDQYTETEDTRCIQVYIPDDDSYLPIIAALLAILGNETNYDNIDTDKVAVIAETWRNCAVLTNWGECNTLTIPIGTVISNPSDTPDAGWLLCDGTQYNRVDYPALAALIPEGTPNIGGDSDVFFVPNMTGRVIVGSGSEAWTPATGAAMGTISGSPTHTLTVNQIPAHSHVTANTATGAVKNQLGTTTAVGDGVPLASFSTFDTGGGASHNNMQPYVALYYWIYSGVL